MNAPTDQVWWHYYSYDCYGNRTGVSKSGSGAGSIPLDGLASLVYTNAQSQTVNNRITTSGYEYDPAGNQTRGQVEGGTWRRYKYDAAGRLAVVMDDSSNPLESYSYGASNERLVTVFGTGSGDPAKFYCWEGGQVIAEYHAGTSINLVWDKNYVHLGGRLLATTDSGGTKYHHPDRLGTRLVTDTSGNVATEQANLPFGTALGAESTGTPTNRRFTSYDRSATTAMNYAVNRFYNSAQGRFNQVDPIGMSAASLDDPQTLNLYNYCGNDPINHVDPDGLFWGKLFKWVGKIFKWIAIAAIVAVAVLTIAPGAWAGTLLAKLSIWSAHHPILSSLLSLHTPKFAILNIASKAGATSAGFWTLAAVGGVNDFLSSFNAAPQGSQEMRDLREVREMEKNPGCYISKKHCEAKCSGKFFSGAANTATAIGGALWGAGQPIIPKSTILGNASHSTSIASKFFKYVFPDTRLPGRWSAPTSTSPLAKTTRLCTFLGRWTPYAGAYIAGAGILLGGSLEQAKCVDACLKAEGKCK